MVCSYSLKGLGFRRFLVCAFGPRMPAVSCGARPHVGRGHAKPPHIMVLEGLEWGVAPKSGEIMAVRIGNGRMESEWLERKRGPAESVWLHEKSHGSAAGSPRSSSARSSFARSSPERAPVFGYCAS